jgi:hypothetical protein
MDPPDVGRGHEETVAACSVQLRDVIDLESVRDGVVGVVNRVVAPAYASLSVRTPDRQ